MESMLTVVGFALTLVGLVIAIWQVVKTRSAVEAYQVAFEQAQAEMQHSHVLMLIPQLSEIQRDVERAIENEQELVVSQHLDTWRWHASQLKGWLSASGVASDSLLQDLQKSVFLASDTRRVIKTSKRALREVTGKAVLQMSIVTDQTSELGALLSAKGRAVVPKERQAE